MSSRRKLGSLLRSEQGTVAIISALVMVAMIGFAALAVDVGSIHYDSRRLQGATDLAALAAASNTAKATQAASVTFSDNGGWKLSAMTVEMGNYDPDPTKALAQRFVVNQQPISAARVQARGPSPIYFAASSRTKAMSKSQLRRSPRVRRKPPSRSDRGCCRSKAASSMRYWARCWAARSA